ncbi:glycerol kinase GlpK [Leucobacter denitrificans]|uniref:Glycerol kinase n=1 Tax=Leucobacter denitrificans TaxID=683042 RepID=A0A7G9S505_9MICO|nr:glycerol kinase GlpK [Leucobacter denitrificans]QNN62930.1 glycerol kinase GlpK [Leucobacter denitrificans]
MGNYILAIDQGTTSTRAIVFDRGGRLIATGQREHTQHMPQAGWVEHNATEIWKHTQEVIGTALGRAKLNESDIEAVGITNQRETTVVWNRETGEPIYNAIVWQDTRTQSIVDQLAAESELGAERFKAKTGLPLASYFSASKIAWILENVEGAREEAEAGKLAFGTTDTWVLWNLTGGVNGGIHTTDVTNASRTMLMDLKTLTWDDELLGAFGVPRSMLPEIRSSSEVYGTAHETSLLRGTPIAGILGDQQAATFGQAAFNAGDSKNTYGTGCFLIFQTGEDIVHSANGLLTTVSYKLGDEPAHYALEGSIAVAGSLVQWLRDQIGLIASATEVEKLAASVDDNGGVYLVPAFSGLFAPYWRPDARGALVGLTRYSNRGHIARAALEAVAYQTRDVLDAVNADVAAANGAPLTELRVDGGMVANDTLMQFQADMLNTSVVRPAVTETTALGAAYAAGLAVGFWSGLDELRENWREDQRWEPSINPGERDRLLRQWHKAVTKSMDWVDDDVR